MGRRYGYRVACRYGSNDFPHSFLIRGNHTGPKKDGIPSFLLAFSGRFGGAHDSSIAPRFSMDIDISARDPLRPFSWADVGGSPPG